MLTITSDTRPYQLPGNLSPFQDKLYRHLIDWKRRHITPKPGTANVRGGPREYDAILPEDYLRVHPWPHLYPGITAELERHRIQNRFKLHNHFYHMASSQAANLNLFLPVLLSPSAAAILGAVKPDFAVLATDYLDKSYWIEYSGGNPPQSPADQGGPLNDKRGTGTDSDIAIAYRNHAGEPCLWLVEHKLTETEFTACGGAKSDGRTTRHSCKGSFDAILADKGTCYYHDANKYAYWEITDRHREHFAGHAQHEGCPFKGGLNQLWRNQLLALSVEHDERLPFKHVYFSVVRHPDNTALDDSLKAFQNLIGCHPSFSTFTSRDVVAAAERLGDAELVGWAGWYRELYKI
jgi:hypothetical protein